MSSVATVKVSIFATFRNATIESLGYKHSIYTLELDLDPNNDTDTEARIGICIGAFIEKYIDPKPNRANRELVTLSHTIISVPD